MAYKNRLGGHTNSYHTYSLEEALEGIAAAGYRFVELTAVRGWTEHVPLDAVLERHGRVGTSAAGALEPHVDPPFLDLDELDVAAVGLKGRADGVKRFLYSLLDIRHWFTSSRHLFSDGFPSL